MAKVTVQEFRSIDKSNDGNFVPLFGSPTVSQTAAAPSGSSAQTSAFASDTRYVRICSDSALHIGYGATATTADQYFPAGAEIVLKVLPGTQLSYLLG